jgi:hypothetical protein
MSEEEPGWWFDYGLLLLYLRLNFAILSVKGD